MNTSNELMMVLQLGIESLPSDGNVGIEAPSFQDSADHLYRGNKPFFTKISVMYIMMAPLIVCY